MQEYSRRELELLGRLRTQMADAEIATDDAFFDSRGINLKTLAGVLMGVDDDAKVDGLIDQFIMELLEDDAVQQGTMRDDPTPPATGGIGGDTMTAFAGALDGMAVDSFQPAALVNDAEPGKWEMELGALDACDVTMVSSGEADTLPGTDSQLCALVSLDEPVCMGAPDSVGLSEEVLFAPVVPAGTAAATPPAAAAAAAAAAGPAASGVAATAAAAPPTAAVVPAASGAAAKAAAVAPPTAAVVPAALGVLAQAVAAAPPTAAVVPAALAAKAAAVAPPTAVAAASGVLAQAVAAAPPTAAVVPAALGVPAQAAAAAPPTAAVVPAALGVPAAAQPSKHEIVVERPIVERHNSVTAPAEWAVFSRQLKNSNIYPQAVKEEANSKKGKNDAFNTWLECNKDPAKLVHKIRLKLISRDRGEVCAVAFASALESCESRSAGHPIVGVGRLGAIVLVGADASHRCPLDSLDWSGSVWQGC